MSSEGYPGSYETGYPISGLENIDNNALAFQAGTKLSDEGKIYTNSGRVLTLACTGKNVAEARARVYHNLESIHFKGSYYRKDIALRKGD
jgi:phosphoribosylamine--glycine ligase